MRSKIFSNGEFYHIYNRGVDKRDIFMNDGDRRRFLTYLKELNQTRRHPQSLSRDLTRKQDSGEPIVAIHAFCLMPNHYHLLVSQKRKNGVSKFMHRLGTAYTKFFNTKYERTGALLESRYKIKLILSTGYLLRVAEYIHANPLELFSSKSNHQMSQLSTYPWSSLGDYLKNQNHCFVETKEIMTYYKNRHEYLQKMSSYVSESTKSNVVPG